MFMVRTILNCWYTCISGFHKFHFMVTVNAKASGNCHTMTCRSRHRGGWRFS